MTGAEKIAAERARQVSVEGYDAAHDDAHKKGQIAWAAACYAAPHVIYVEQRFAGQVHFADPWPWAGHYDKRPHPSRGNYAEPERATPEERVCLLVKAGALIAAEIDRLERAGAVVPTKAEERCYQCGGGRTGGHADNCPHGRMGNTD